MDERLVGLLPSGICDIFEMMEVAEEETKAIEVKCEGEKRGFARGAFRYLCPGGMFKGKSPELYRWHCREIILRLAVGVKDLELGTMAEVVDALSEMSMVAPLPHDHAVLYGRLFEKMFPGRVDFSDLHESYRGATDELLSTMRRKLSKDRDCRVVG